MKGFKKVENKSVGEVVDALLAGEDYYLGDSKIVLNLRMIGSITSCIETKLGVNFLKGALENGSIYQKVDWTEQLDGTYENGVWCKVWDNRNKHSTKVLNVDPSNKHFYYVGMDCNWKNAEPVSEELAELLEKEMK